MERQQHPFRCGYMRSILVDDGSLFPNLCHNANLQLLQVSKPPVHKLGRTAGSSRSEILHFHQRRLHPAGSRIKRYSRSGNPPANHQHVKSCIHHVL
ncbi:hypothetical protein D3C72_918510 [compost metagenome]